jgi:hypothetical protein
VNTELLKEKEDLKMWTGDRILVLEVIDDKAPKNSSGLVDSRLFKGGNRLHAIRNPQNYMWSMKYDAGGLPEPLKQNFTSFAKLKDFVTHYFHKRNLRIASIENA